MINQFAQISVRAAGDQAFVCKGVILPIVISLHRGRVIALTGCAIHLLQLCAA